jgi:phosphoglycolate phosphatase
MIDLLVFDLDGTLCNTGPGVHQTVNELLRRRNLSTLPKDKVLSLMGSGLKPLIEKIDPQFQNPQLLRELIGEFKDIYREIYLQPGNSEPYSGVIDFLNDCPYRLAIVSNKSEEFVRGLVDNTPLRNFDWLHLVGGDTYRCKKPDPLPINQTLKICGAAPEQTVMIGDGRPDMEVAINTGLKSVAVEFGFTPKEILLDYQPTASFSHYGQLDSLLNDVAAR